MIKEYYYLVDGEQKGPITVGQLKSSGMSPETLVWGEGMEGWLPLKEVKELQDLLKKLPPPIPFTHIREIEQTNKEEILFESTDAKNWIIAKISSFTLLGFGVIVAGCYLFVDFKRSALKAEITSRINNIFNERSVILDGENYRVQGRLTNTSYNKSINSNKRKKTVKTKLGEFDLTDLEPLNWGRSEKLYTIFECRTGGFTVKKLTKVAEDSFDLEVIQSGDMGYRSPEYRRGITGYNFNDLNTGVFYGNIKANRLSVQEYYNLAFDFNTKNDKTGSYTPGKLNDINGFSNLGNEYFSVENIYPTSATSSGRSSISWESVGDHSGGLTWDDAKLYWHLEGKHYEIVFNKDKFKSDLFKFLGILGGMFILCLLIFFLLKANFFSNLALFGVKWLNSEDQTQLLIFTHSFWSNNQFSDIRNDRVLRGILKISDKGSTINLSYPDREIFYKINALENHSLSLTDIKTGNTVLFKKLGVSESPNANQE